MRSPFNFPLGLATGVVTMCVVCAVYDPRTLDVLKDNAVQIITIFATVGAAAVAYAGILRQIGHHRELEEERRQRELEAERAGLTMALERLCEICRIQIQDFLGHENVYPHSLIHAGPELELYHIESIKSVIRFGDDFERGAYQGLLRLYQLSLRYRRINPIERISKIPAAQTPGGCYLINCCYQWALLHASVENFLEFKLNIQPELLTFIPAEDVLQIIKRSGADPDSFSQMCEMFTDALLTPDSRMDFLNPKYMQ